MLLKPTVLALSFLSVNALAQNAPVLVVDINSPSGSNTSVAATQPAPVNHNAQLLMLVDQLQEELRYLRGQVEQQSHEMKKMQTNQRDRYRDLDRRIMAITQQLSEQTSTALVQKPQEPILVSEPATGASAPTVSSAIKVQKAQTVETERPVISASQAPTGVTDKQAYDKAFKLVRAKAYDEAVTEFSDFVRFYPSSSLVPGAIFWTAEVYRAMTPPNQEAAKLSYEQLIAQYPQHPKAANAYYKLGLAHDALGNKVEARKTMQRTIDLYPDLSVSQLARDYLSK